MTAQKSSAVFYGWRIVAVSALGLMFGFSAIVSSTFGMFVPAMSEEFAASRAQVSLGYSLAFLAMTVCVPLVGQAIDRFGAKVVILACYTVMATGFASFYLFPVGDLLPYYAAYVLVGIGGSGANPLPYSRVIAFWFDRRRGLALGLAGVGTGVGMFVMPIMASRLLELTTWRGAQAALGLVSVLVVAPFVALVLRERPEDMGLVMDGGPDRQAAGEQAAGLPDVADSGSVFRNPTFWKLAIGVLFVSLGAHGVLTNLISILSERGVSRNVSVLASSVLASGSIVGRVLTGYLVDRFFAPYVGAMFLGLAALSIALGLNSGNLPVLAIVAAGIIGLAWGAEVDLLSFLTSRYFALGHFGKVYGYVVTAHTLGAVVGPFLMAVGFDWLGSYRVALSVAGTGVAAAALLIGSLGTYRYRPH